MGQVGPPGTYGEGQLSPDGQRLALTINEPRTLSGDVWIYDLARNTPTRFVFGPAADSNAVWAPDGRRLAYFSCCEGKSTLYIKDVGDAGKGQTPLEPGFQVPADWSRDGRFILFTQNPSETKRDLWVLPMDGDRKPFPFLQTPFSETRARFSPDGRWVAFASNETGRDEVYVTRFDRPGEEKWRISTDGGRNPCWRRDGKELFFLAADKKLMAVAVKAGDTFESGAPAPIFRNDSIMNDVFDVTADGQRFIVSSSAAQTQTMPFTVVVNWTADLKR